VVRARFSGAAHDIGDADVGVGHDSLDGHVT
jgi:hypothetical protein